MKDAATPNETVKHPLDPITAAEIATLKQVLEGAGHGGETIRYSYVMLREPARETLAQFSPGGDVPREIGVLVTNLAIGTLTELVVDIPARKVVLERGRDPVKDGWSPVLNEDYFAAEEIAKADPRFVESLAKRGITNLDEVFCCPLSAGVFGFEEEKGRRMLRVLSFRASDPDAIHALWAHPIEGVVCHVDLTERRVLRFVDTGYTHVPEQKGDYVDPAIMPRETMKPLNITQPEGASFTIANNVLEWEKWSIRVGFNGREGLTLHDIAFRDGDRRRSILHRASVSEMVVPYGEPQGVEHSEPPAVLRADLNSEYRTRNIEG